jgi:hypothetical protein
MKEYKQELKKGSVGCFKGVYKESRECEYWTMQSTSGISDKDHDSGTVPIVRNEIRAPAASRPDLARSSQGRDARDNISRSADALEGNEISC